MLSLYEKHGSEGARGERKRYLELGLHTGYLKARLEAHSSFCRSGRPVVAHEIYKFILVTFLVPLVYEYLPYVRER